MAVQFSIKSGFVDKLERSPVSSAILEFIHGDRWTDRYKTQLAVKVLQLFVVGIPEMHMDLIELLRTAFHN